MINQKNSPLILAVDTSGRTGSIAIGTGDTILKTIAFSGILRHSRQLFTNICDILDSLSKSPDQIEHVYISIGPGSFTGLRISTTLAKMMHLAAKTRIAAVSTLDLIAENATDFMSDNNVQIDRIAVILDAKRGQFFVAIFDYTSGGWLKMTDDSLVRHEQFIETLQDRAKPIYLLGEGLVYYKELFSTEKTVIIPEKYWYPKAEKLYRLGREKAQRGEFADPVMLSPVYLRQADAVVKSKKIVELKSKT